MLESLIYLGLALTMASAFVFYGCLLNLNNYLQRHQVDLWKRFGTGNKKLHFFAQYYRLRSLAIEYTSDDKILNDKLKLLNYLNWGIVIGTLIISACLIYALVVG